MCCLLLCRALRPSPAARMVTPFAPSSDRKGATCMPLRTVYLAEGEKTPVESRVVTTGLRGSKSTGWRGIPVELRGWCLHVKAAELSAQTYGAVQSMAEQEQGG